MFILAKCQHGQIPINFYLGLNRSQAKIEAEKISWKALISPDVKLYGSTKLPPIYTYILLLFWHWEQSTSRTYNT